MNAYGVLIIYGIITLALIKKVNYDERKNFGKYYATLKKIPPRMKIWSLAMICGVAIAAIVDNLNTIWPKFELFMESQTYTVKVLVAMLISVAGPVVLIILLFLPIEAAFKKSR